jgi:adenylate kinase family enzyme
MEESRFSINPESGTLRSGQRQNIEIIFQPSLEKVYTQKMNFKVRDNAKQQFQLSVKGFGINYNCEIIPNNLKLGPVLPYYNNLITPFEIKNPTDVAIEVYSVDFDQQYKEEDEMLRDYEGFPASDNLFLPVRKPGEPFWREIKEADEKRKKIRTRTKRYSQIMKDLKDVNLEEEKKEELEKEKEELTQQNLAEEEAKIVQKYPPVILAENKFNIILIGPEKCGKTSLSEYLSERHDRGIINMATLLDWNIQNQKEAAIEAQKVLESQSEALEKAKIEKEKLAKRKKKTEPDVPINEQSYSYLPKEILLTLLQNRLTHPDCNCGAIFDNLVSPHYPSINYALELICEALETQNLQVIMLHLSKDEDGNEFCVNYRYMKRKRMAEEAKPTSKSSKRRGTKIKMIDDASIEPKGDGCKAYTPEGIHFLSIF